MTRSGRSDARTPLADQRARDLLRDGRPGEGKGRIAGPGQPQREGGIDDRRTYIDQKQRIIVHPPLEHRARHNPERHDQIGAGDDEQQRRQPDIVVEPRHRPGEHEDQQPDPEGKDQRDRETGLDLRLGQVALARHEPADAEILKHRHQHRRRQRDRIKPHFGRRQEEARDQHADHELDRKGDILRPDRPERRAADRRSAHPWARALARRIAATGLPLRARRATARHRPGTRARRSCFVSRTCWAINGRPSPASDSGW